jgi:hypothetical protein
LIINNFGMSAVDLFEDGYRFTLNDADGMFEYWADNLEELLNIKIEKGIDGGIYVINVTEIYDRNQRLIDRYHEYVPLGGGVIAITD